MSKPFIIIKDDLKAEDNGMLQALYSRSSASVVEHVNKVEASGSTNFMSYFYVGYGHKSIGDCGSTTIYIEGVSFLAAKAIQDNPLYSGQETSTRYINFSNQPVIDPIGSDLSKQIQDEWISIYSDYQEEVVKSLKELYPMKEGDVLSVWEKAIKARSFDIMRGFLPTGATTQLSWTTNLRQAYDKLSTLVYHPLEEVRLIANETLVLLKEKYPSSFSHRVNNEVEAYKNQFSCEWNYSEMPSDSIVEPECIFRLEDLEDFDPCDLDAMEQRPKGADLPKQLKRYGDIVSYFKLDYGSFRDIQRHRNGLCRIPLLTTEVGFNEWYIDNIPTRFKQELQSRLNIQLDRIFELQKTCNKFDLQYYIPLGFNVIVELVYDLPQMVYVLELRSSTTVHPTLRKEILSIGELVREFLPALKLYMDTSPDSFCYSRGKQDIITKK